MSAIEDLIKILNLINLINQYNKKFNQDFKLYWLGNSYKNFKLLSKIKNYKSCNRNS